MKKMKDSCFNEFDPNAMSVEAALESILKSISSIKTSEYVDLKSTYGRILSKNIKSKINVPNYKNSAMDGYAVNVGDFNEKNKTYDCIGESFAGNPFLKPVKKNQAIKVMTGGMVPSGCNAVVMKELITHEGRIITTKSRIIKDQNIRFPGEDIKKNEIVLKAGKEIDEIDIGILASLGIDRVFVKKRPIIGFVSTGDELVSIKKPIKISQVYDSNRSVSYTHLTLPTIYSV